MENDKRKLCCKLVVSDNTLGRIIGKGGKTVQEMKTKFEVRLGSVWEQLYSKDCFSFLDGLSRNLKVGKVNNHLACNQALLYCIPRDLLIVCINTTK